MGRSIISPKTIAKTAKELGYDSVIMCDDWTISGMTHLFAACREQEIKAICGVNVKVYDDPTYRPPSKKSGEIAKQNDFWEAKLIVKNETGLKALFRLMSIANIESNFYYTPRVGLKELILALKTDGLILLTGDFNSLFSHKNASKIYSLLEKHVDVSNRFIELIPIKSAYFDKINKLAAQKARETASQTIYSRPALYLQGQDKARDVMSHIVGNSSAKNRLRNEPFNRDLHIMSPDCGSDEVLELMKRVPECNDLPECVTLITRACTYEWAELDMCLPKMAENEFEELTRLCREGWKTRLSKLTYGYKPDESLLPQYAERLKYELKVLRSMGFDRYFLLVRDVIMWCKTNKIMVGPARGCFVPDSKVVMSDGSKKAIQDVAIGSSVISHDGSIQKVIDKLTYQVDEELVELEFEDGRKITCTKDHEIHTTNRGWVKAIDLTEDDDITEVKNA